MRWWHLVWAGGLLCGCGEADLPREADLPAPRYPVPPECLEHRGGGGERRDPDEIAPVGLSKQLLVDDFVVADSTGVVRRMGEATKENGGRPVLEADRAWEHPIRLGFYTSVVYDDDAELFRMFYLAQMPGHRDADEREASHTAVGYAESEDGLTWTKPTIGADYADLVPGAPSVATNVVHRGHGFNAMIDPSLPAGHPEKLKAAFDDEGDFTAEGEEITEAHIAHAADPLGWQGYNAGESVIGRAADTANQILFDPISAGYMMVTREDLNGDVDEGESRGTRVVRRAQNQDLLGDPRGWADADGSILGFSCAAGADEWVDRQIHATLLYPYESVYFAFVFAMEGNLDDTSYADGPAELALRPEVNVVEFYIAPSRDAVSWDLAWAYASQPLIPRGGEGAWDKGGIHSVNLVTKDDRHLLFYNGAVERFGHGDSEARQAVGLATLRLDGFVAIEASDEWGSVTTRPFSLEGPHLEVNADASKGDVQVEVLDADGQPLEGYRREEAQPQPGADGVRLSPSWETREDLSALVGETVRLRFHLRRARLYAFQVTG